MTDPAAYRSDSVHRLGDEPPLSNRDFERLIAIIRAAGDEITTFREASLAFRAIREQLSIMTRVFAGSVIIAIGCFGYFFMGTTEISKTVARIDERLSGVEGRLDGIDKRLDALTAAVERLQPPQKQGSL
jgi:hypothetical protein